MAILFMSSNLPNLYAVYGFGSAFRSCKFNDIDLLAVVENSSLSDPSIHKLVCKELKYVLRNLPAPIDVTVLTECEAVRRPLKESAKLVPLFQKE
jgi:predicted nucleotidyltransferase